MEAMQPMKEKHRSRERILFEILKASRDPVNKTRIVFGCNLNFQIIEAYLEDLKASGMILEKDRRFQATIKGLEYVSRYRDLELLVIRR